MKLSSTLLFTALVLALTSNGQIRYLKAILQGSQQVPANSSTATGVAIVKYNTSTKILELWGDYQGLTTNISASHIHSPAPIGANAPVLITLANTGGTTGNLTGGDTLTAAQETDLFSGLMYVNVHNSTYPGGEIRGQLSLTTNGQTEYFNARLQGAQEVPPNGSQATGYVNAIIDKATDSVFLTGSYSGLTSAATASHIHTGQPSTNGPVIITLSHLANVSGTIHVASPITAAGETEMLLGNTYVNIHNSTYPGGEIRGQLTQLTSRRFFVGILESSQQVPPNPSTAKGTVGLSYNTETRFFELIGDYQNLSSNASAAHIHAPAPVGANAGVIVTLTIPGGTSGTITGSGTLTAQQEADLFAGLAYVNVHSANYPGGEIRAQLTVTTANETQLLVGRLQGTQQVPPNNSTGEGVVNVLLDKETNKVYVTGNFVGLTSSATAAHIHGERAGLNGPVVVPLSVTAGTVGTVTGSMTVTPAFAQEMIKGNSYVNIHTSTNPGGELRAQLGDLVLPVKLLYFNGFKEGSKIILNWESAQEINASRYEVEQQSPAAANEWIKKVTISAKGNPSRYSVTDLPIVDKNDVVLYRLKMIDKDGRFSYSQVIRINYRKTNALLSISPNPVTNGELRFTVTGLVTANKATVSIIDVNGRTVHTSSATSNLNNTINVTGLPTGLYRLIVRIQDTVLQQNFTK